MGPVTPGKALDEVRAEEHRPLVASEGGGSSTGTNYQWQKTAPRLGSRSRNNFMTFSNMIWQTTRDWRINETVARLRNHSDLFVSEKVWRRWVRMDSNKVGKMLRGYKGGCPRRDHGVCFSFDARGEELPDSGGEKISARIPYQAALYEGHSVSSRRTQPHAQELDKLGLCIHI